MLILVFSEWLGVLPPSGRDGWRSLVLPAISLAAYSTAIITRLLRSNVLDVLQADHVRTARSKGLAAAPILLRHVLRNAAIPTVAVVGLQVGSLLGGAVITEQNLRLARHGPARDPGDLQPRLRGGSGFRAGDGGGHRGREPAGGCELRAAGPASARRLRWRSSAACCAAERRWPAARSWAWCWFARVGGVHLAWFRPGRPGHHGPASAAALPGEGGTHWLGSDALGRDVLARVIVGARVVVGRGVLATACRPPWA